MLSAVPVRGLRGGTGALNPLALQIRRDFAAVEPAGPGVAHRDAGPADRRVLGQEGNPLVLTLAARPPLDARAHQGAAIRIERGQRRDGVERGRGEHVPVAVEDAISKA